MAWDFGWLNGFGIVDPATLVWAKSIPASPVVWTFAAGPWTGLPTTDLSEATSRTVTWRLQGNSEASLTMPGLSTQTATIQEMISDLWVMRNGLPLFRGRFGASSDSGDEDSLSVQFGCADYRELLHRRFLWEGDTLSYLSVDQAAIAWGILSATQGKAGGNLGIIQGLGSTTGVVRTRSDFQAGDSIGDRLDSLSQVLDGFDYDINPVPGSTAMTFDLYYPSRGSALAVVLDYGGRVAKFSRTVDPSTFGNAVRATGVDTLTPVRVEAGGISTDPAGRWDLQWSDQSITVAATLTAKANQALADGQYVQPAWTVTLPPNSWGGPDDFWLGDQITLVVNAGRLNVVESLRVYEIGLSLDQDGNETITATLGAPNPSLKRAQRTVDRRLAALERR